MAAIVGTCSKAEQRFLASVSLSKQGVELIEVHRRMKVQYSDAYLSLQEVHERRWNIRNDLRSVSGSLCQGQGHRVVKTESISGDEHPGMIILLILRTAPASSPVGR